MIEAKVVCKRSGCQESFTPTAAVRGARKQFCSDSCRASKYQPKQVRLLGLCKKCGNQIIGRYASRRCCDACKSPSKPPHPEVRTCTTCKSDFYAVSKSGPLPLRCNFCKQRGRAWVLRHCTWCGDLFGSTSRNRKMCSPECGALWAGSGPSHFRASERQETKTCAYCKAEFRTSISIKTHCSKRCLLKNRPWKPEGMKAKGARSGYAKARREAQRAGDQDLTTYTIWKAEGGHCRLCNKATIDPTTPRKLKPVKRDAWASLDHIKPISAGGTHTWANAQLLCYPCNSGKVHTDRALYGRAVIILNLERATVPSAEFANPFGGVGLPSSQEFFS
jgi:hypothetical protein